MCAGCVNNLKLSTCHCFHWTQVGQDTSYLKENIENSVIINSSISRWKVVMFWSRWELLEQLRLRTAPLVFPETLRWQIDLIRFCFIPSITWDSFQLELKSLWDLWVSKDLDFTRQARWSHYSFKTSLWSSRNILRITKLHPTFHQQFPDIPLSTYTSIM